MMLRSNLFDKDVHLAGGERMLREFTSPEFPRPRRSTAGVKVSIVMPSFNQVEFVERSILSVLNQDYPNVELIIADGGSTDGTVDILRKYNSEIAYWISERDRGQSDALNRGFAHATGDVVGWLNSDDLYFPGAVASAVDQFAETPDATVVFGDWWSIDASDHPLEAHAAFDFSLFQFVYEGFTHNSQGMFWTRSAHGRFGEFDVGLHRTMDYDLIVRLGAKEGEGRFARIPHPLACFRRHEAQKTSGQDEIVMREHRRIAQRIGFSNKYRFPGRILRFGFRGRRAYWYAKRRGLLYALLKFAESLSNKAPG